MKSSAVSNQWETLRQFNQTFPSPLCLLKQPWLMTTWTFSHNYIQTHCRDTNSWLGDKELHFLSSVNVLWPHNDGALGQKQWDEQRQTVDFIKYGCDIIQWFLERVAEVKQWSSAILEKVNHPNFWSTQQQILFCISALASVFNTGSSLKRTEKKEGHWQEFVSAAMRKEVRIQEKKTSKSNLKPSEDKFLFICWRILYLCSSCGSAVELVISQLKGQGSRFWGLGFTSWSELLLRNVCVYEMT